MMRAPLGPDPRPPSTLEKLGAAAVAFEAVALAAWVVVQVAQWFRGRVDDPAMAGFLVAFGALVSVGLVAVSRGLWRGVRWPRGAAVAWQVLQFAAAVSAVGRAPLVATLYLAPVPVALAGVAAAIARTARRAR